MTVNVKIVMMEDLWCDVFLIQKQFLLNIHISYFSVVTPSLGILTLRFFWQGVIVTLT